MTTNSMTGSTLTGSNPISTAAGRAHQIVDDVARRRHPQCKRLRRVRMKRSTRLPARAVPLLTGQRRAVRSSRTSRARWPKHVRGMCVRGR